MVTNTTYNTVVTDLGADANRSGAGARGIRA